MAQDKFARVRQEASAKGIEFIDLKVVDLDGRLHHLSFPMQRFSPEVCQEGIGFDGSSYGFLKVENSDMVLIPDLDTARLDPFRERRTLTMFASAHLVDAQRTPFSQDGRCIVRAAERVLRESGIAAQSLWAPEYEFYVFDAAEFGSRRAQAFYRIESEEQFFAKAYHACNPHDRHDDFRDEVCAVMQDLGIPVRYHHHEVGGMGQQEIEGWFSDLTTMGDNAILSKYVIANLAARYGLKVTFMPKPLYGVAGSGWHLHQFLVDEQGRNLFQDGDGYAGLSRLALGYVAGILTHSNALCAFTNPSTNSYKRLVPGFEAPTSRSFGRSNRGAAIRVPSYVSDPQYRRVEYRPPDFTCNPYLCAAAILMAGIDGALAGLDPVACGFPPEDAPSPDRAPTQFLPRSLDDALDALEQDHQFLLRGGVFPEALIRRWIELKRAEIQDINTRPHPYEYTMYFDR